ncbi:aminotransferase class I/II-fold pyridoxal phosphate-dependent enzyme [Salsipaludibacter albus]|uniref:aminotransferase class I/II-fold pyridoxal phosphate-dependent enzyme n=1 Tax=Salsipaludibacter albus TaxID=2849650 RepID=UPI001EE3EE40|nr:aminotransferase class I/II-fold pyridoxal phosphate-dependent enzyme [Salsipaludibacter albus]
MTGVVHGGADGGPPVRWDFSTNANALGPSPVARRAVAAADVRGYPDPAYTAVRTAIASQRGRDPSRIVVGAGASELIHRVVARVALPGPRRRVLVRASTFGEYRHAAEVAGVDVVVADSAGAFRDALGQADVAFLCVPNNPDGEVPGADWLAETARLARQVECRLVLDLAYWPLARDAPRLPDDAWHLWAPNKSHGTTGVRAGWLELDEDVPTLHAAPSWIVSAVGVAFLHAVVSPEARDWVAWTREVLWRWRDDLRDGLDDRGITTVSTSANWLLAEVGDAGTVTPALRTRGIRVRDASSFGRPAHVRLSAQPPPAVEDLLAALDAVS